MASEPKEDCVHFLVLTDVGGNRTYGVVAQYYRPLHVGDSQASPDFGSRVGSSDSPVLQRGKWWHREVQ